MTKDELHKYVKEMKVTSARSVLPETARSYNTIIGEVFRPKAPQM